MTKRQSAIDVAVGLLGDLQEAQRTGSKQACREALREEFVRRSGASSSEQALAMAMTSLMKELIPELSEKTSNRKVGVGPKKTDVTTSIPQIIGIAFKVLPPATIEITRCQR